jgi:hypothetical protein
MFLYDPKYILSLPVSHLAKIKGTWWPSHTRVKAMMMVSHHVKQGKE